MGPYYMASFVYLVREFLWRIAEAERNRGTPIFHWIKRAFSGRAGFTIFQEMGSGLGCRGKLLEKHHGIGRRFSCKFWG